MEILIKGGGQKGRAWNLWKPRIWSSEVEWKFWAEPRSEANDGTEVFNWERQTWNDWFFPFYARWRDGEVFRLRFSLSTRFVHCQRFRCLASSWRHLKLYPQVTPSLLFSLLISWFFGSFIQTWLFSVINLSKQFPEVVRTRMREENAATKGFFSTLKFILRREGFWAFYRGLGVQVRQIFIYRQLWATEPFFARSGDGVSLVTNLAWIFQFCNDWLMKVRW